MMTMMMMMMMMMIYRLVPDLISAPIKKLKLSRCVHDDN
jgi:hypothetical protein